MEICVSYILKKEIGRKGKEISCRYSWRFFYQKIVSKFHSEANLSEILGVCKDCLRMLC